MPLKVNSTIGKINSDYSVPVVWTQLSVGKNGANRSDEVMWIQYLLKWNRLMYGLEAVGLDEDEWEKFICDGRCGPLTRKAILSFQRWVKYNWDSRVADDGRCDANVYGPCTLHYLVDLIFRQSPTFFDWQKLPARVDLPGPLRMALNTALTNSTMNPLYG
jgi:hypothetical protein